MKGYYRKIFLYIGCALVVVALFAAMNSGVFVEGSGYTLSLSPPQEPVDTVDQEELEAGRLQALVLWDKESEVSEKYAGNLERVLGQMEFSWELLDIRQKDAVSCTDYDLVIVAFDDWDGRIGEDSRRLLRYVEQEGRLFLGMAPSTVEKVLPVWYRAMGVTEYGEFVEIEGIFFDQELLAGSQGRSFVEESFSDSALGVQLANSQYLLASGVIGDRKTPLIWKAPYGEGQILTCNATGITGDMWTGVAGGCVASLFDEILYTKEGEEGSVYVQDFSVAEDGIAEYPRVTSGMLEDTYDEFAAMNACALYGAFSHFVHPDDILDEERGGGQDWEDLFQAYCDKLGLVNRYFEGLRPLTAVEAGQALRVADALDVSLTVEGDTAAGRCNGFTGSACCYLRTDKDPQVDNETCRIFPVCGGYEGCWYLVEILQPEFSFSLKE